jgi:hypothetical protein
MALKLKKLSVPSEADAQSRPDPAELLKAVREADPTSPPARVQPKAKSDPIAEVPAVDVPAEPVMPPEDPQVGLNVRVRLSTSSAIEAEAAKRGITMKVLIMNVLRDSGIEIAEADLRDRSAKSRKGAPRTTV